MAAITEDRLLDCSHEDIIDMDLKRSMIFCDENSYDPLKRLLLNVSLEFKSTIGYYQGMNYIAMFILEAFKDEVKAYHFFCHVADKILTKYFSNNFEGIVKLIWICDKMMQIHSPSLWEKLRHGGVSAIHFSVPNLITLFTSLIKNPDAKKHIYEIWDIMLCDGLSAIVKALIYILEIQKVHIDMIESEQLLMAMRNVESDPFSVLKHSENDPQIIQGYLDHLSKHNLRRAAYDPTLFDDLQKYYTDIVAEIHQFWSKPNSLN
jgi:hypothetical protein